MKTKSDSKMSAAVVPGVILRNIAVIAVAATVVVSIGGCYRENSNVATVSSTAVHNVTLTAAQRQHIHLLAVTPSTYHKAIETTGVVDFDHDQATSVLAPFGGPVSKLFVSLGDTVKAGQPLAEVNSPDFATAISSYQKALVTARTDRQMANLDKDLLRHHGISRREEVQAQTDASNAAADRDAALQALVALGVSPRVIKNIQEGRPISRIKGMIRAPITGTVIQKLINPGQLLQVGTTPCFTIANLSHVWVMAQVFGPDLTSVRAGDSAEIRTGMDENAFPGTVTNISPQIDPRTHAVQVRVVVKNNGDFLKKNMYVSVKIQARQKSTGFLVPVSSILRDDVNRPFVYVAQPDGSFARRHVTLGYRDGNQYAISSGLSAGDEIVVEGAIFLQFMQDQ